MKRTTREELIDAAMVCLKSRRGGTTAEDVAARAGVSRSSFYRYFKGMDEVVTEIALLRGKHFLADALANATPHAASGTFWSHFVFYAVKSIENDPLQGLLAGQNALRTVELVYHANQATFDTLKAIILPSLKDGQERGELHGSIPVGLMADWLLRQIWCLSAAPMAGGWSDDSLLQYVSCFVVPGIVATPPPSGDMARLAEKLDRVESTLALIGNRILAE